MQINGASCHCTHDRETCRVAHVRTGHPPDGICGPTPAMMATAVHLPLRGDIPYVGNSEQPPCQSVTRSGLADADASTGSNRRGLETGAHKNSRKLLARVKHPALHGGKRNADELGGLMGVAGLQTLIDHNVAANVAVLGANVTAGVPAVSERLTTTAAMLAARGMDAVAASRAATNLLGRVVTSQATVIAFDTAFNAVALLFVIAAPVLVTIKIGLSRYAKMRAARSPRTEAL